MLGETRQAIKKEHGDESSSFGKEDLRQVQGHSPAGRGSGDLQQPEA
jgi:hypothetical protein